jgi:4-hydroxy-tetrahydrodipicolinate synthase
MFRGTYTALVTPFKNGEIDFDAYAQLIERQIEGGVQGIVPAGCTGEAATLSPSEQLKLIGFAVEQVKGRIQVIAGTGSNNTREAIELTEKANEVKLDGVLVISPYYNKPTQSGLLSHYCSIADASRSPVMIYNVPGRTGVKISASTIAEMAKHSNINSVKEACGSIEQVMDIASQSDITILSGDDPLTVPMISIGGQGVVSVTSNVAPKEVSAMVQCALDGDFQSAKSAHYELLNLHRSLFVETNPIPVKAVLSELGLIQSELRRPLESATETTLSSVRSIISEYHLKA